MAVEPLEEYAPRLLEELHQTGEIAYYSADACQAKSVPSNNRKVTHLGLREEVVIIEK